MRRLYYVFLSSDTLKDLIIYKYMMLGFRLLSGPDRAGFIKRFGLDYSEYFNEILCNLKNKGLICFDNNAKLTSKGLDFANEVFREFI